MKKPVYTFITLLLLNFSIGLANSYAQSGCCKEREDEDESWIPNTDEYEICKDKNDEKDDEDKLLKPKGKIWWDLTC